MNKGKQFVIIIVSRIGFYNDSECITWNNSI